MRIVGERAVTPEWFLPSATPRDLAVLRQMHDEVERRRTEHDVWYAALTSEERERYDEQAGLLEAYEQDE